MPKFHLRKAKAGNVTASSLKIKNIFRNRNMILSLQAILPLYVKMNKRWLVTDVVYYFLLCLELSSLVNNIPIRYQIPSLQSSVVNSELMQWQCRVASYILTDKHRQKLILSASVFKLRRLSGPAIFVSLLKQITFQCHFFTL